MIVKRSGRNQIAIPKQLIQQAGLGSSDQFFNIEYVQGCFVLQPVVFEQKIPEEAVEKFRRRMIKRESGDQSFSKMNDLIRGLDRKPR